MGKLAKAYIANKLLEKKYGKLVVIYKIDLAKRLN